MASIIPSKVAWADTRDGNHYQVFTVTHTTGAVTDIIVDLSAVSACELPNDITVNAGLVKETTTSAGVTIADPTSGSHQSGTFAAEDGIKTVRIASAAASGTYIIVVRHVGSAAGVASSRETVGV